MVISAPSVHPIITSEQHKLSVKIVLLCYDYWRMNAQGKSATLSRFHFHCLVMMRSSLLRWYDQDWLQSWWCALCYGLQALPILLLGNLSSIEHNFYQEEISEFLLMNCRKAQAPEWELILFELETSHSMQYECSILIKYPKTNGNYCRKQSELLN